MAHEIRPATMQDYEALDKLWREGDEHHYLALSRFFRRPAGPARSREFVASVLNDEDAALFVAERDGAVVGLLHVWLRQTLDHPPSMSRTYVMVDSVVVARAEQRSGVGTTLMGRAESWAREKGANQLELQVWEFNAGAVALYEKLGYRTVSRRMWKALEDEQ